MILSLLRRWMILHIAPTTSTARKGDGSRAKAKKRDVVHVFMGYL